MKQPGSSESHKMSSPLQKELLISMMKKMLLIRRFEETFSSLSAKKKVPGWLHLSIGQEAVATGACMALESKDWVVSGHRAHGHAIAKGVPLEKIAAELFGKETGCCKGRGGSMHIIDSDARVICTSFVGSGLPIAAGLAMSSQLKAEGAIVVAFAGDGASNTGAFHESLNLSAIWKLPVVFVIENNQYAISTPVSRSTAIDRISKRAQSYGIPGVTVDGNDVQEVYVTVSEMVARAREGEGPSLVECLTYRLHGHYEGEQWQVYRSAEEVKRWSTNDPLLRLKQRLKELKIDEVEIESMDKEARERVDEAVSFAMRSPDPSPSDLSSYIFS